MLPLRSMSCVGLLSMTLAGCQPAERSDDIQATPPQRQVPSPDWQRQIVYLAMVDRFDDGNPENNDQGMGEYDPSEESHFSGGDLQGVLNRLDYIQALGATTLWLTPVVANQWWDETHEYGGYHGYWARDFTAIDEHFGDLDLYQQLSASLHQRDMYLVQDVVVNHTGNFFSYEGGYSADDPTAYFVRHTAPFPTSAPTSAPFDLNDANDPQHRAAAIYHWTPEVNDIDSQQQEFTYQLGDLDDINTTNPVVIDAFKRIYGHWIKTVGIDAFRMDTVKYVEHDFWHHFVHDSDGILATAKATGRDDFWTVGEVKMISAPMDDSGERKIARFLGSPEKPELQSAFAFPLQESIKRVFAEGRPTGWLGYRLQQQMLHYRDPYRMANFIDNHDVPRLLSVGSTAAMRQALAFIMTIPGIPVIYMGNEQDLHDSRQAMFDGGYLAAKGGSFDPHSAMYRYVQSLTRLRLQGDVFTHGDLSVIAVNDNASGLLALRRSLQDDTRIILFNTAEHTTLAANVPSGLPPHTVLKPIWQDGAAVEAFTVDEQGLLSLQLPPRSTLVLAPDGRSEVASVSGRPVLDTKLDGQVLTQDTLLTGHYAGDIDQLSLVIDGNLDTAIQVASLSDRRWQVLLPVTDLGRHQRSIQLFAADTGSASEAVQATLAKQTPTLHLSVADPLDDDHGPTGNYRAPTDPTFSSQMDIEHIEVHSAGQILQLTVTMQSVTDMWIATNGFDHVAFSVFFDLPNQQGVSVLPGLNATMPEGRDWELGHTLYGWGNGVFTAHGATAQQPGKRLGNAPQVDVSLDKRQITMTYSSAAVGLPDWRGVGVYLTTWDKTGEGGNRPITPEGGVWDFGGAPATAPRIMDEAWLKLPE